MRLSIATTSATCVLVLLMIMSPSAQAFVVDAVGTFAENSVRSLLWPLGHGKCFNLNRLDPTCPQCL